ncbi:MAG: hypothetical protein GY906_18620 [bacterium]|nr:hypothetical protein [bacterium]
MRHPRTTCLCTLIVLLTGPITVESAEPPSPAPIPPRPYLGQTPPGGTPELFAPAIISTDMHEHACPSFDRNGHVVFWTSMMNSNYNYEFPTAVTTMKLVDGRWTPPEFAGFNLSPSSYEAILSPDGMTLFFSSTHPRGEEKTNKIDIWSTRWDGQRWSSPQNLGSPINTPEHHESKPSVTRDGTLYFLGHWPEGKNSYGIYRSRLMEGTHGQPELLPPAINTTDSVDWTPWVAPDESYLLFSSLRPGGYGSGDIWVSFRSSDDSWSEPVNLGPEINQDANERYPCVSSDGKYLFFVSDKVDAELLERSNISYTETLDKYRQPRNGWSDVYWVNATVIEKLRRQNLEAE